MKIPAKKYLTSIGVIGLILLLAGMVLLTSSLIRSEKAKQVADGIKTTARVVSVREDSCSRGRWSSRCYDLSIQFTDVAGSIITTILADEFDKPQSEQIAIVYSKNKPEVAQWDTHVHRPWLVKSHTTAFMLIASGLLLYIGSLVATRRASP